MADPLLIVDGDNLAHRAFHSTPKTVTLNAITGFFSMLARIWGEESCRGVFVAWDTLGAKTYRDDLWPAYQGGRFFDPALVGQLNQAPDLCRRFRFGVGKQVGFEADDLMASAAAAEPGPCLLLTTDRDSYQLVSERVKVLSPKRGTPVLDRIGPEEVVAHFGVLPEQVPDFKALAGDSSDKIPGIRGIGPRAAASLLLRHGSLEGVVGHLSDSDAELALRFREVARMRAGAPVELPTGAPDWGGGSEALRALGLDRLADRLAALVKPETG